MWTRAATASGSAVQTDKCSGAKSLASTMAAIKVSHQAEERVLFQHGPELGLAVELRELGVERGADGVEQRSVIGDEADDAVGTVFGLGEQVGGDPGGMRPVRVGEDEDFARAGELVDGHGTEHLAFRLDDVGVAGAEDFDDGLDGLRAVGEGGDGLRTADLVDLGGPGEFERAEERGGDVAVARRRGW